jgi:hypothetical protein
MIAMESTHLLHIGNPDLANKDPTWRKHFNKNIVNLYKHLDLKSAIIVMAVHSIELEHWYLMAADTRTK